MFLPLHPALFADQRRSLVALSVLLRPAGVRSGPGRRSFVTSSCFRDRSKYTPHQSERERSRRCAQLQKKD